MNEAFQQRLGHYRAMVLPRMLAAIEGREPARPLYDLVRRHLERAGKGFRPALLLATTSALGGEVERAVPSAAALEMLHNAFLVHDDIEDESELRRDRPTMHVEQGIPLAVNAGDAMQALSLGMLRHNVEQLGPALAYRVAGEFEHMLMESLEGQAMELGWIRDNDCSIGEDDYLRLVLKKTCWYSFIHPCRIGALVARGPDVDVGRFDRFGYLLGAAFQIQDDLLNLVGDRQKYGKEIRGDLWEGKRTLMLAHLFRRLGGADAHRLGEILARPRRERQARDVDWIYEALVRHGSLTFARQAARELAAAAERELETAFAEARPGPDLDLVRQLVRFTVEREL